MDLWGTYSSSQIESKGQPLNSTSVASEKLPEENGADRSENSKKCPKFAPSITTTIYMVIYQGDTLKLLFRYYWVKIQKFCRERIYPTSWRWERVRGGLTLGKTRIPDFLHTSPSSSFQTLTVEKKWMGLSANVDMFFLKKSPIVLVFWAAITKAPQTVWFINKRNLFLTVLKAEKSKIMAPEDLGFGESSPSGSWTAIFSLCPHVVKETRDLSGASLMRLVSLGCALMT